MFPFPIPNLPSKLVEKLGSLPKPAEKGTFELKFNESRGIAKAFTVNVLYDKIMARPFGMHFVRFENDQHLGKALICKHNCAQNIRVRFFIKYVPDEVKPFSLKLTICPDCGAPMAYQFFVYPGDLNKYPKMRDIHKYKNPDELPRAKVSPEYRIGVE